MKKPRVWRLLPENTLTGWTPYAWLIYLPTFLIQPIQETRLGFASWWTWPLTITALFVFLISYFRGHWLRGRGLVRVVWLQLVMAVVFAPVNSGSSVFFVYSASFAAQLPRTRDAVRSVLLIALCGAITSLVFSLPAYFVITSTFVTLLIGFVNTQYAAGSRTQNKLRLAHEQIEHLAAVAERERIARDLHDVLGHTLSLIVLKAELASKLSERDPARAAQEIRDVESVSRHALHEVREAIRGYRATLADELARSRTLLDTAGIRTNITAEPAALPRGVEEALALSLREAVTNVVRHSEAEMCSVSLEIISGDVILTVQDDGRGVIKPEGNGLRGMRERIDLLGGQVTIVGSCLTVSLPLSFERVSA